MAPYEADVQMFPSLCNSTGLTWSFRTTIITIIIIPARLLFSPSLGARACQRDFQGAVWCEGLLWKPLRSKISSFCLPLSCRGCQRHPLVRHWLVLTRGEPDETPHGPCGHFIWLGFTNSTWATFVFLSSFLLLHKSSISSESNVWTKVLNCLGNDRQEVGDER